ncbi:MAG TPA: hypothetical protein VNO79_11930 [Actinomycetota bacterium]|nr:hypothetical protein [Actinomycetota bacterium]
MDREQAQELFEAIEQVSYKARHGVPKPPAEPTPEERERLRREQEVARLMGAGRRREAEERGRRFGELRRALLSEITSCMRHGHRLTNAEARAAVRRLAKATGAPEAKLEAFVLATAERYAEGDAGAAWRLAEEVAGELVAAGWEPPAPEARDDPYEGLGPRELAALIPRR